MAESLLELDGKLDYDRERSHTRTLLSLSRKWKMLGPNYVPKPGRIYDLKMLPSGLMEQEYIQPEILPPNDLDIYLALVMYHDVSEERERWKIRTRKFKKFVWNHYRPTVDITELWCHVVNVNKGNDVITTRRIRINNNSTTRYILLVECTTTWSSCYDSRLTAWRFRVRFPTQPL